MIFGSALNFLPDNVRYGLAGLVALLGDAIDYFGIGAAPVAGEPVDFFFPAVIAWILDDYRPLMAMWEMASVFPPVAAAEFFIPSNLIVAGYTIQKKRQEGGIQVKVR